MTNKLLIVIILYLQKMNEAEREKCRMMQRAQDYTDTLLRMSTLTKHQERSQKFYRSLASEVKKCNYRPTNSRANTNQGDRNNPLRVTYENHTAIPNALKTNVLARRMTLHLLKDGHTLCVNWEVPVAHATTILHIPEGGGILRVRNSRDFAPSDYALEKCKSWEFTQIQLETLELTIRPSNNFLIIVIEQFVPEPSNPIPPTIPDHPHEEALRQGQSWIQDETNPCVFLSAKFAVGMDNNLYPVKIAILNQRGEIEMNTHVCPRTRIKNWQTPHHEVNEDNNKNQPDHHWVYQRMIEIFRKKIIIGMGTYEKLKHLKVNLNELGGIRDLRTNKAFKKDFSRCEASRITAQGTQILQYDEQERENTLYNWSLKHLMYSELGLTAKTTYTDVVEEVLIIRDLFKSVRLKWKDHIIPNQPAQLISQAMEVDEGHPVLPHGFHFKKPPKIRITRTCQNDVAQQATTSQSSKGSYIRKILLPDETREPSNKINTIPVQQETIKVTISNKPLLIPKPTKKITDIRTEKVVPPIKETIDKIPQLLETIPETPVETIAETPDCYIFETSQQAEEEFPELQEITPERKKALMKFLYQGNVVGRDASGVDIDDSVFGSPVPRNTVRKIERYNDVIDIEEQIQYKVKHRKQNKDSLPGRSSNHSKEPRPKKSK
jgi:hypothetical protein